MKAIIKVPVATPRIRNEMKSTSSRYSGAKNSAGIPKFTNTLSEIIPNNKAQNTSKAKFLLKYKNRSCNGKKKTMLRYVLLKFKLPDLSFKSIKNTYYSSKKIIH
ncbi:MAG: hypothetical protein A2W91_20110 [Bacteroidetes bacterium GWF2_38_335]|nr:MAG: hypothetical protein A2W91_20110 [Bacteroidetes bacterium GWF2_38_335]OFY81977.1 MAG: hypothetical protein A2281_09810 [Bacteroidetes bacterium RIFOXYA12_FULL_38_20]HBS86525.1 hypothetical protein [Bacteroidales bacterium]